MRISSHVLAAFTSAAVSVAAQTLSVPPPRSPPPLGPKTIVPALVACTDRPTITAPVAGVVVVAPHAADTHEVASRNQLVVLNAGTLQGLMAGQQFFTRRLSPPVNGEPMSSSAPGSIRTSGWLTVVAAGEHHALARVDYSCTAIEPGDYLEPYGEPALPSTVGTSGRTNFDDLAHVLFGIDRRESFGAGDVLSIDRGTTQGMVSGSRLAVYRDRRNGTPLVEIGVGIVIETSAETSKVVLERTTEDVRRGDYVGVKGRP